MRTTLIDLTGKTFTRLTVIERAVNTKTRQARWLCRCSCGTLKTVASTHLIGQRTLSCGCYAADLNKKLKRKHGASSAGKETREYRIWKAMKTRCTNPNVPHYGDYGGRGITICERWLHDFSAFLSDMGPCPPECSIDRINNDGPYSPENCRWATRIEQANNKSRRVHRHVIGDRVMGTAQAALHFNVSYHRLKFHLGKGLPLEQAVDLARTRQKTGPCPKRPSSLTPLVLLPTRDPLPCTVPQS